MAGKSSRLAILLDLDGSKFEKGLNRSLARFKSASKRMEAAGRGLSMGITAPLALVGASSFQVAKDFELAMAKVAAVSGGGADGLAKLTEQAKALGGSTSFSASEVSGLQLELSKLGFSVGELVGQNGLPGMTNSVLNLSKAFDTELGETATVVGETLRQFGLDASDTGRVSDVMAASFASTGLDLQKFGGAMGNVAPIAKEFGFSLEETAAILGVMANNGIAGTDAGTKLKMAFSELAKTGVPVKETFKDILAGGVSYTDALDKLGTRAAILGPVLGNNLGDLHDLTVAFEDAEGTAQGMADVMGKTASDQIAAMQSAIEAAQIELGTALAPTILEVANVVRDLAASFAALDKDTKDTIVKIGLAAASLGPLLIVGGKVTAGIGSMSKAFKLMGKASEMNAGKAAGGFKRLIPLLMNPAFLAGAAALAAIGVALAPLVKRMNSFAFKTSTAAGALKELNKRTAQESAEARTLFTDLKNAVKMERDRGDAIQALQEKYPGYLGNLDLNKANLQDIADLEKQVTDAIGDRIRAQLLAEAQQKKQEATIKVEKGIIAAENVLLGKDFDPAIIQKTSDVVRDFFGEISDGTRKVGGLAGSVGSHLKQALREAGLEANLSESEFNRLANSFLSANVEGEGLVGDFDFLSTALHEVAGEVEDTGASLRRMEEMTAKLATTTADSADATNGATDAANANADANKKQGESVEKTAASTKTLAETVGALADELAKTTTTEGVFGEEFGKRDEERARALSEAINEIIGEGLTGDVDLSTLKLTAEQLEAIGAVLGEGFAGDADAVLSALVARFSELQPTVEAATTPLDALRARMAELQTFERVGLIDGMEAAQEALSALETALANSLLSDPTFEGSEAFNKMVEQIALLRGGLVEIEEQTEKNKEKFNAAAEAQRAAVDLAGTAVDALFDKNTSLGESLKESAAGIAKSLIKQALATAIANAISSAFSPASPDNIVTGGAAAPAKAAGLVAFAKTLFSQIPAFAAGGAVLGGRGGTLALIGENPASRGEFIVPFEKMGRFMEMAGAGNGSTQIHARVLGDHLQLSSDRSRRKLSRRSTI